jgi:single-strand DNA-binding protein
MNQLNSIILEGNVVRKAELSEPSIGFKVCKFPLAVNRHTKTPNGEFKSDVSYFDVETYGQMAETCSKWCDKGQGIRVVGRLKQSRWEENKVKHSRVFVVAEHVEYKFDKKATEEQKAAEEKDAQTKAESPVKAEEIVSAEKSADSLEEKVSTVEEKAPEPVEEEAVF